MKNLIVAMAVALTAGSVPAIAGENPKAEKEFAEKFAGAQNVKWTELHDGYFKVSFTLNGVRAESYFDENAELIGTVRNLFYSQLPLPVMQSLSTHFANAVVVEIVEVTNLEGTSYKVILEKADKRFNLKLDSQGNVTERQRTKLKK
jgi:hypothetical protein